MSATTPATDPPWGTVTVLALSAFASSGMTRTLDPLLPRLARVYDIPVGHAAWAITAFGAVYGLLQAFYGPVGDRHGKLRVIAIAALISVFACLGCALASGTFAGLVLARALAGACCAASLPLGTAWIGDAVPYAQRQGVLARFMMGQMTGMASGQMLGGLAAEHAWWQWPFLLFAAVFAISGLLLWRHIGEAEPEPASVAPTLGAAGTLLEVLRQPWARVVLMTVLLEGYCYIGAFTYIATHLHRVGGLSLNHAGLILIGFSGGGLLFALLSPRYGTRIDEPTRVALGSTLAALSLAVLATPAQAPTAAIAIFLSGLGFYLLHNALQLNATQMAPDRRGAAVALFTTCFFVGQALGVASFGLIADRWGTTAVLLLGAASLLPLGLGFARQLRRREDAEPLPA